MEIEVTLAGTSSLLLLYNRPVHTLLLPPSTAHRPESAPARDTAPARATQTLSQSVQLPKFDRNNNKQSPDQQDKQRTNKAVDADTLAVVDAGDRRHHIVEEDLRETFSHHGLLQGLVDQCEEAVATHGVQQPLHRGERVSKLLVLVDPVQSKAENTFATNFNLLQIKPACSQSVQLLSVIIIFLHTYTSRDTLKHLCEDYVHNC